MIVPLFGGALDVELPDDVIDVSDFRQVPDNQEVFLVERGSGPKEDKSIIIELLESPEGSIDQVLKMHLSDLLDIDISQINDVEYIKTSNSLGEDNYISIYKDSEKNLMVIFSLVRVSKVQTDILLSFFLSIDTPNYQHLKDLDSKNISQNYASLGMEPDVRLVHTATEKIHIKNWLIFSSE
ncbi:hypothetical protein PSN45_004931 [Yamadazyma tenuis]|uniref:Mog1p/PsbP-like protein n=1 Tax=Candida tenuis (strain ATCC 10573 / BCRC 21748 / CBS 615 / JCM 9827 / NBRC 10315 / NRRL Y-1498 / VKM Y-70) TaxID=590646 RepID=G3B265_CANTC|nr:Mog1p/PsbP-like protein [Yamadazyma tenuis ATCC 10573]XP_006685866.1 uncharacterized protein CANTEDRAFT_113385 [Yamadazyma tenuis ATCC 10573]EGV65059.1 Mog1p/PsbP-like protein [Yamadazyma tenuis ATCC 10573]EGV65060.1 hypothetical protein CANTEDRAFT_113385 [Yamadazyma tenuis ATCC 10573]WEJ97380.1 hypothetical protein PSN45_004931 [Yamadazyma tenuis]